MLFDIWESQPVIWPTCKRGNRGLSRQQVASARSELPNYLARLMERTESFPSESCTVEGMAEYDNLLRRGIIDRNIDQNEGDALTAMAVQWRLGNAQIDQIHRHCMRTLVRAAIGDGIVTKSERRDLSSVAHLLGLSDQDVAILEAEEAAACGKASKNPGVHEELAADLEDLRGRIVCFTGESNCSIDGTWISHEVAKTLASSMGVVVIESATKKLDYLIVSDIVAVWKGEEGASTRSSAHA